jgi:hypothetical protein
MKRFAVFLLVGTLLVAQTPTYQGAGIKTPVAINKGGTGTASTLTGLVRGNASAMTAAELSGDASTGGSNAVTLATVNAGPGSCGDSTHVCQVTTNAKGLTTSQSAVAISVSGGAMVQLETHAASNSATLDFTTCLTNSSYHIFKFNFNQMVPATSGDSWWARVGTGGGPTWDSGSHYAFGGMLGNPGGTGGNGNTNTTQFALSGNGVTSTGADTGISGQLTLYNPAGGAANPVYWATMYYFNSTNPTVQTEGGNYTQNTAVTGFRFLFSTGNITSGTITCYGVTP